ncbi:MAG: hypothetical protein KDD62_15960, partial [Bdellovibrionales bacterium]|nr:hypothetical protein [Bdellovibrionales bacterium]
KAKAKADLKALVREEEKQARDFDRERLDKLQGIVTNLRKVAPAGVTEGIRILEEQIDESLVKQEKANREIKEVIKRLGNVDAKEVRNYEQQRSSYETEIGTLQEKIRRREQDLRDLKSQISQQREVVLKNKGPEFDRLKVEEQLVDALEGIFEESVTRFTDELRKEVQDRATEVFLELTTDSAYSGLQINENYGLTILLENGEPVSVRSAGAEQIVAFALIAALNALAAKRGPVIMDTPLGRLDKDHRENILEYLPSIADQVVLMVHDGEVDRERDLAPIAPKVGLEYRINHPTPTESELVKEGSQIGG